MARSVPLEIGERLPGRDAAPAHVQSLKVHLARVRPVPFTHPAHDIAQLLGLPHRGLSREQLLRIAGAAEHVVVDGKRLGQAGFDREHVEAHLADQVFEHPVLQLEDLARAVRRLAEADGTRIAHDGAKRREIGRSPDPPRPSPVESRARAPNRRRPSAAGLEARRHPGPDRRIAIPRQGPRRGRVVGSENRIGGVVPLGNHGVPTAIGRAFDQEDIAVVAEAARQPNLGARARTTAAIDDAAGQTPSAIGELEPQPGTAGFDVGHPGGRVIRRGRRDAVATRSEAREAKAPVGRAFHLDEPRPGRVEQAHRHQRHPRALHRTARGIDHGARDRGARWARSRALAMSPGAGTDAGPAPRHAATNRNGITRRRRDMSFRLSIPSSRRSDGNRAQPSSRSCRGAGERRGGHPARRAAASSVMASRRPPGRRPGIRAAPRDRLGSSRLPPLHHSRSQLGHHTAPCISGRRERRSLTGASAPLRPS